MTTHSFIKLNIGLPIKQEGGSIATTGTTSSNNNGIGMDKLGAPIIPTYPKDSAEADKAVSAYPFGYNNDMPISFYSTTLAGSGSNALKNGNYTPVATNMYQGTERLNITSMSVSGTPTFGANRGVMTLASGQNGVTGKLADQTLTGEFNYTINGVTVVNGDY